MRTNILKLGEALKNANDILIVPHTSPDGDAIGSCVALKELLKYFEKNPKVYLASPISKRFSDFEGYFEVYPETDHIFDMVIYVDCGEKSRVAVSFPEPKVSVCIDHHVSNTSYCDINIIDALSPATGEIMFEIFKTLEIPLNNLSAMAIYMAIVCDTGGFIFDSTRKNTHLIASELYNYDFPRYELIHKAYLTKTVTYTKLETKMLENLFVNKELAIGFIDNETYESLNVTSDDTDGLSNMIRNIEGIKCGVILIEKEKGIIKGSIRTSGNYNANELAGIFGGGGHVCAAGFKTELKSEEIKEKINEWVYSNK